MENVIANTLAQWGAIGILISLLIIGLYLMFKWNNKIVLLHREERKEWLQVANKCTEAINNNTAALSRIEVRVLG